MPRRSLALLAALALGPAPAAAFVPAPPPSTGEIRLVRGDCPPGLAKKHNGCLPPGQARKHYVVGERLPPDVVVYPVPGSIVVRLPAAPAGHYYRYVDGDVILIAAATRIVVDAILGTR